jgi:hypothetical protein
LVEQTKHLIIDDDSSQLADKVKSQEEGLLATVDVADLIFTVRGKQVLLDSDVARLYGYETKAVNQTVRRNSVRFPERFRFQLTQSEMAEIMNLRSQIVTSSFAATDDYGGRRYLPYVFTEQGIAMLSGLLKSKIAVDVSIGIMDAFVEMRKLLYSNQNIYAKIIQNDIEHADYNHKFDELFGMLQHPNTIKQNIFYKGQFYDAYQLVRRFIKQASSHITIIDNYIDETLLDLLTHKSSDVNVTMITSSAKKLSASALDKFTKQYGEIEIVVSKDFHDRFIILDGTEVYALGASIKDLGNKCFEVSKNEDTERFCDYVNQVVERSKLS